MDSLTLTLASPFILSGAETSVRPERSEAESKDALMPPRVGRPRALTPPLGRQ